MGACAQLSVHRDAEKELFIATFMCWPKKPRGGNWPPGITVDYLERAIKDAGSGAPADSKDNQREAKVRSCELVLLKPAHTLLFFHCQTRHATCGR